MVLAGSIVSSHAPNRPWETLCVTFYGFIEFVAGVLHYVAVVHSSSCRLVTKLLLKQITLNRLEDIWPQLEPTLRKYLARRLQPAEVDDAIQSVAFKLVKSKSFGNHPNPDAFAMQTTKNVFRDFLRTRQRGQHSVLPGRNPDHQNDQFHLDIDQALDEQEQLERLSEVLNQLRPMQRRLLTRLAQGCSYDEIAKELGYRSRSRVAEHRQNALDKLKHALRGEERT